MVKHSPFTFTEWAELKLCERIIREWNTAICNGAIQDVGGNGTFYRFYRDRHGNLFKSGPRAANLMKQAADRARTIAARHGLSVYAHTDPREIGLYLFSAADLRGRDVDTCYRAVGRPVC